MRIITLGAKHEFQRRGIETVLIAEIIKNGLRKGPTNESKSGISLVHDDGLKTEL